MLCSKMLCFDEPEIESLMRCSKSTPIAHITDAGQKLAHRFYARGLVAELTS